MRSALVLAFTAALLILAQFQDRRWKAREVYDSDAGGYYVYLPALFIHHDLGRADSVWATRRRYQPRVPPLTAGAREGLDWGLLALPATGRVISKYPPGVALGALPWFGAAHVWATARAARGGPAADGYGVLYQRSSMVAGLAYVLLGLILLRALLRRYFDDTVSAWTLASIGLGTNLFYYGSYEAALAHAPLFLWHTALLACTARWHETPRARWALGIGLSWGLVVLCRPSDGLFGLLPLLWGLGAGLGAGRGATSGGRDGNTRATAGAGSRLFPLRASGRQVLLAALAGAAVVSLLPLFWHHVSGAWLLYTYGQEGFDFAQPHLLEGLFSFRKGWLLYTPMMALALLGGLGGALRRQLPAACWPTLVLVPLVVYLTFSWEQWWYGGSFSARPLISLYPLLSLSLASLWAAARARRHAAPRRVLTALTVLLLALSLLQTRQYAAGVIHWDSMTRAAYFANFWRLR